MKRQKLYRRPIHIRWQDEELQAIDAMAASLHKTRSEYIRDAERAVRAAPHLFLTFLATGGKENPSVEGHNDA